MAYSLIYSRNLTYKQISLQIRHHPYVRYSYICKCWFYWYHYYDWVFFARKEF